MGVTGAFSLIHMVRLHDRIGTWNMLPKDSLPYTTKQESRWDMMTQRALAHLTACRELMPEKERPNSLLVSAQEELNLLHNAMQESKWNALVQRALAHLAVDEQLNQEAEELEHMHALAEEEEPCSCGCEEPRSNEHGACAEPRSNEHGACEGTAQQQQPAKATEQSQGGLWPSVASTTDKATTAAAKRRAARSLANAEFFVIALEARQPRATVSRPSCSRTKRDEILRARPGGRRRKTFTVQRGLSLMLRDNLLTAAFKALRNVDWSSIVCALTLLTAMSVVLLSGLLATGAEEKPKHQLYEGALKMAA